MKRAKETNNNKSGECVELYLYFGKLISAGMSVVIGRDCITDSELEDWQAAVSRAACYDGNYFRNELKWGGKGTASGAPHRQRYIFDHYRKNFDHVFESSQKLEVAITIHIGNAKI